MWKWVKKELQWGVIDPATLLLVGLSLIGLIIGTIAVRNTTVQQVLPKAEEISPTPENAPPAPELDEATRPPPVPPGGTATTAPIATNTQVPNPPAATNTPVATQSIGGTGSVEVSFSSINYTGVTYIIYGTVTNNTNQKISSVNVIASFPSGAQGSSSPLSNIAEGDGRSFSIIHSTDCKNGSISLGYSAIPQGNGGGPAMEYNSCSTGGGINPTNPPGPGNTTTTPPPLTGTVGQCNYTLVTVNPGQADFCSTQSGSEGCEEQKDGRFIMDRCRQDASCRKLGWPDIYVRCYRYNVNDCQKCQNLPRPGPGIPSSTGQPGTTPIVSGIAGDCSYNLKPENTGICSNTDLSLIGGGCIQPPGDITYKYTCRSEPNCDGNPTKSYRCHRYGIINGTCDCQIPPIPTLIPSKTPTPTPTTTDPRVECSRRGYESNLAQCTSATNCTSNLGGSSTDEWYRCTGFTDGHRDILCCGSRRASPTPTGVLEQCSALCVVPPNFWGCRDTCGGTLPNIAPAPNTCTNPVEPPSRNCCCSTPVPTRPPAGSTPQPGCSDSDSVTGEPNSDIPTQGGTATYTDRGVTVTHKDTCSSDGRSLTEYFCMNNTLGIAEYDCDSCTNTARGEGICINPVRKSAQITVTPRPGLVLPTITGAPRSRVTACSGLRLVLKSQPFGSSTKSPLSGEATISYETRTPDGYTFPTANVSRNDGLQIGWSSFKDESKPLDNGEIRIAASAADHIGKTQVFRLPSPCSGIHQVEVVLTQNLSPTITPEAAGRKITIVTSLNTDQLNKRVNLNYIVTRKDNNLKLREAHQNNIAVPKNCDSLGNNRQCRSSAKRTGYEFDFSNMEQPVDVNVTLKIDGYEDETEEDSNTFQGLVTFDVDVGENFAARSIAAVTVSTFKMDEAFLQRVDFDHSGQVNVGDYILLQQHLGTNDSLYDICPANHADGIIDSLDASCMLIAISDNKL